MLIFLFLAACFSLSINTIFALYKLDCFSFCLIVKITALSVDNKVVVVVFGIENRYVLPIFSVSYEAVRATELFQKFVFDPN